jgi:hypothetical protein
VGSVATGRSLRVVHWGPARLQRSAGQFGQKRGRQPHRPNHRFWARASCTELLQLHDVVVACFRTTQVIPSRCLCLPGNTAGHRQFCRVLAVTTWSVLPCSAKVPWLALSGCGSKKEGRCACSCSARRQHFSVCRQTPPCSRGVTARCRRGGPGGVSKHFRSH